MKFVSCNGFGINALLYFSEYRFCSCKMILRTKNSQVVIILIKEIILDSLFII
jgi:hypothetical protein